MVPEGRSANVRDELLAGLKDHGYFFTPEDDSREFLGYEGVFTVRKVANVRVDTGQPIHLMVTTAETVEDLLTSFDISTHQVAIMNDGRIVRGSHWAAITVLPSALKDTPTTPARMVKIARRYGHEKTALAWERVVNVKAANDIDDTIPF